jgi:hypothetical protein
MNEMNYQEEKKMMTHLMILFVFVASLYEMVTRVSGFNLENHRWAPRSIATVVGETTVGGSNAVARHAGAEGKGLVLSDEPWFGGSIQSTRSAASGIATFRIQRILRESHFRSDRRARGELWFKGK